MALAQRPPIGVSDVVYAVRNESTGTYGTIKSLANALEVSVDQAASITSLFADNGLAFSAETTGERVISFGIADLLPDAHAELFGHSYANGITEEKSVDQSPYIAMGFKILRGGKDGANDVYEYVWLPRVMLSKPNSTTTTKGATVEYQTPQIEGRILQLSTGVYRTRIRTDDPAASATTLSNWFTAVVQSTGANLTAVTVGTITGDNSDNTITIPFAKGGATFSLRTIEDYDITVSVVSTGALLAGTSTYTYSAAGTAPTIVITNSNIDAVQYLVTVSNRVEDNNGVAVTPLSQLVTPGA